MSEQLTGFDQYYASLDDDLLPYHTMLDTWKAAQQSAVPSVPDGYIHVEDVKQLCRDYSSRTNNVYIKDVESSLDAMALRAQEKVDVK